LKNIFDIIIIGAGIVGLGTAYNLLKKDSSLKLCIIEKESGPAMHQTGHNSGVIHSGIYYKPGSLKALNCIRGYQMLVEFCTEHRIPFDICGKVIIATEEKETERLEDLHQRGLANGLSGCRLITSDEIKELEPNAAGLKGIFVPQTGIVDYRIVSEYLAHLLNEMGCRIIYNEQVQSIKEYSADIKVTTNESHYTAKKCVACAGLFADRIASMTGKVPDFRIIPFRGEYYEIRADKRYLVRNLIYPVPDPEFPFLGVHFTRRVDGSVEAGPNAVLAFKREGYKKNDFNLKDSFDTLTFSGFRKLAARYRHTGLDEFKRSFSKKQFTRSLRRLIPSITEIDLIAGGAGVRAQACGKDGNLIDDFLFIEDELMINVCNAPSPAATASLSIGDTIAEKVLNTI
jgi:L-2-hydroxyglutarate oxidase